MSPEHQIVYNILRTLALAGERHLQAERGPIGSARFDLYDAITTRFPPLRSEEVERLFKQPEVQADSFGRVIYLPYMTGDGAKVPVLTVTQDFTEFGPDLSLGMGLFLLDPDKDGKERLTAVGFRFETPEGIGEHGFHHAQLVHALGSRNSGLRLPNCPTWFPTSYPALALDADGPLCLLVGLIVSLYGVEYLKELSVRNTIRIPPTYMERMRCLRIPKIRFCIPAPAADVRELLRVYVSVVSPSWSTSASEVVLLLSRAADGMFWDGAKWSAERKGLAMKPAPGDEWRKDDEMPHRLADGIYTLKVRVLFDDRCVQKGELTFRARH